jgi:hypothetical protein
MGSVAPGRNGRPRLPMPAMLCVIRHLAPGLPPGPYALLVTLASYGHDAGCGIHPGQRRLAGDLRSSPVSIRQYRDELLALRLLERLPRAGPHGVDLYRLRLCDACQRDSMQSRCEVCQRANLQHAETVWWSAQRDSMQSQKNSLQVEPTEHPVDPGASAPSPNGERPAPGTSPRHPSAPSGPWPSGRLAGEEQQTSNHTPTPRPSAVIPWQDHTNMPPILRSRPIFPIPPRWAQANRRAATALALPQEIPSVTLGGTWPRRGPGRHEIRPVRLLRDPLPDRSGRPVLGSPL